MVLWLVVGWCGVLLAGAEERMAEIRNWYGAIQEAKPTSEKEILFEAADEPLAGEMTVRAYPGGLKAITLGYGAGDHGGASEHYYFRNGELFFIFVEESTWRFAGGEDAEGNPKIYVTLRENRYYLKDGKCFRFLTRGVEGIEDETMAAKLKKAPQEVLPPGDEVVEIIQRGQSLAKATTARDILKAFAADLEPAE